MEQVQPNSSPSNKSKSIYSVFIIEAIVIGILAIFIIITLQFFNIINLPFLEFIKNKPREIATNEAQKTVQLRKNGGTCKIFNPKLNVFVKLPSASLSAELMEFSGVWEGKWNGTTNSVLIVNQIDNKQAKASYYFRSPPTTKLVLQVQPDGKTLKSADGETTWTIDEGGFLMGQRSIGNQRSMVSMVKCRPKIIK